MTRMSLPGRLSTVAAGTAVIAAVALGSACPAVAVSPAAHPAVTTVAANRQVNHYAAARHAWVQGASAPAAEQNRYWLRAARALVAAPGDRYFYRIRQLIELTTYPNTGLSPTQIQHVRRLTRSLDGFFHTPNLYF